MKHRVYLTKNGGVGPFCLRHCFYFSFFHFIFIQNT